MQFPFFFFKSYEIPNQLKSIIGGKNHEKLNSYQNTKVLFNIATQSSKLSITYYVNQAIKSATKRGFCHRLSNEINCKWKNNEN